MDLDFDGKVQFTEFLIAGCNKRSLFTQHNIEKCFRVLDIDEDEEISCNDLQNFLGEAVDKEFIEQAIKAVDINKDGGISLEEFYTLMMKVLKASER